MLIFHSLTVKGIMRKFFITTLFIAAIIGCTPRNTECNCGCGSDRCIVGRFIESVSMFDNVNHADKFQFPELTNDPLELDAESRRCADSLGTDMGIVMSMLSSCNMMKAYVHEKGMALRTIAPQETVDALDRFEASFDTLFHKCVSQEYYLRLFHDCFNGTIPGALDSLAASCRNFALKEEPAMK